MNTLNRTIQRLVLLFMASLCLLQTGCLHALGLNHSSLRPRANVERERPYQLARLDQSQSVTDSRLTVRSQDSTLSGDSPGSGYANSSTPTSVQTISLRPPSLQPDPAATKPATLPSVAFPAVSENTLPATSQRSRPAMVPTSQIPSDQRTGVRLSLPSFVRPESGLPGMLEDRPSSDQSQLAVQPPQSSSGSQLGFTADQLRQFMNKRSQNPMTSGQLLADKQPQWKVLSTGSGHSQLSNRSLSDSNAIRDRSPTISGSVRASADVRMNRQNTTQIRQISNTSEGPVKQLTRSRLSTNHGGDSIGAVNATEVSVEQPFPTVTDSEFAFRPAAPSQDVAANVANVEQDAVPDVAPQVTPTDDSMLSRLKGLYDPSEDGVARKIWKRQIPRLPNPWNVFKDKSEAALQSAEDFVENAEAEITAVINPETPIPAPAVTSETASSLLAQLVQEYELRLETWPRTPAERPEALPEYQKLQQELRLLYLLQDRPEDAASAIEMISPSQQQFWQSLILSLAEYREAGASNNPSTHFTGSLHQLRSAAHALSPLADLRIRRLDICSRILSYGRIEAFPSNDFDPGRPLLLYVELENFGTQTTQTGHYLASFDATLQIFEKGKDSPRETIRLTDITDESTSVRTDYFQSYDLTLPSHLMAGEYEIRLKLRDKVTGKIARGKVAFQVR